MCTEDNIRKTLNDVIALLVENKYERIYELDFKKHFEPENLKMSIEAYLAANTNRRLTLPPVSAYNNITMQTDIVEIDDTEIDETVINIHFDLWLINDEGRSGPGSLTLGLDFYERNNQCLFTIVHLGQ